MNNTKEILLRSITKCILILLVCVFLGTLLLFGTYLLPVEPMKENVARSSDIFDYEGVYPQLVQGYKSSQLDNCTDAIMLGIAIDQGTGMSVAGRAMLNQRTEYRGENPVQSLNDYAHDVPGKEMSKFSPGYGRYWHGYLVVLKPLLLLFDYGDIRYMNMILQAFLIGWLGVLLIEQGYKRAAAALGITLLVLNPLAIMLSLQFSSVYYLMLIASIIIIKHKDRLKYASEYFVYFFLLVGILTSYFDFLTYPAITLGIPLILFLVVNEAISLKVKLKGMVQAAISWGAGYGIMWAGKWLAASILLKTNMFSDAFSTIIFRTSMETDGDTLNWMQVVWRNVRVLVKWPYVMLGIIILVIVIWRFIKSGADSARGIAVKRALPYFLMALLPFIWFLFMGNHSYEHYWFTFRELGITCFAVLTYLFYIPHKLID